MENYGKFSKIIETLERESIIFSEKEIEILKKHGEWLHSLATGEITPETEKQKNFILCINYEVEPETTYEHLWLKVNEAIERIRKNDELIENIHKLNEKIKKLEGKDVRIKEVEKESLGLKNESAILKKEILRQEVLIKKLQAIADKYEPIPPAELPNERFSACHRCGGDGGAGGRCSHCGGNGFEPEGRP